MADVQSIIERAMRLAGLLESGESASSDELSDGLLAVNNLLSSWQNERLIAYAISEITHTLTANDGAYTIGSGADIDTTRPVKIESAYIRSDNVDYPIQIVDVDRWNRIADKTVTGPIVDTLYYDPTMSTGTVYLYPVPSSANVLHLFVRVPISSYSAVTDTVTLPPGWDQAITFNVAPLIALEYGREVSATVHREAMRSLAAIKRVNRPQMRTYPELGDLMSGYKINIFNGE